MSFYSPRPKKNWTISEYLEWKKEANNGVDDLQRNPKKLDGPELEFLATAMSGEKIFHKKETDAIG